MLSPSVVGAVLCVFCLVSHGGWDQLSTQGNRSKTKRSRLAITFATLIARVTQAPLHRGALLVPGRAFPVHVHRGVDEESSAGEDQGRVNGSLHHAHHGLCLLDYLRGHRDCSRHSTGITSDPPLYCPRRPVARLLHSIDNMLHPVRPKSNRFPNLFIYCSCWQA